MCVCVCVCVCVCGGGGAGVYACGGGGSRKREGVLWSQISFSVSADFYKTFMIVLLLFIVDRTLPRS